MTGQYDELISFAYRWLLPPDVRSGPKGEVKAEWVGAGAVVAAGWLESDRTYTMVQVRDFWFDGLYTIAARLKGPEQLKLDEVSTLFCTGFYWMLQFEIPGPEVTVH